MGGQPGRPGLKGPDGFQENPVNAVLKDLKVTEVQLVNLELMDLVCSLSQTLTKALNKHCLTVHFLKFLRKTLLETVKSGKKSGAFINHFKNILLKWRTVVQLKAEDITMVVDKKPSLYKLKAFLT